MDSKVRNRRESVLLTMADGGQLPVREIAKRATGDGGKHSTVQRDLTDMMRTRLVEQDAVGHGYRLTPAGKKAADAKA